MAEQGAGTGGGPERDRLALRPDCSRCFGLCCVAPPFSASPDFAIDKAAGQACPHLRQDFTCHIHSELRERGFGGCTVYDCFGAGQQVAQVTFGGTDWRQEPQTASQMFAAFMIMRQLHELLWYLAEALDIEQVEQAGELRSELGAAFEEIERLAYLDADALVRVDVAGHRRRVNALLLRAGDLVRVAGRMTRVSGEA
jgi:hypothetical protein